MLNTTASAGETSQMTAVFRQPPRNKAGGARCSGLGPGHPAADGATPQVTRTGMGRRWDSTNASPTKPNSADTWLCLQAGSQGDEGPKMSPKEKPSPPRPCWSGRASSGSAGSPLLPHHTAGGGQKGEPRSCSPPSGFSLPANPVPRLAGCWRASAPCHASFTRMIPNKADRCGLTTGSGMTDERRGTSPPLPPTRQLWAILHQRSLAPGPGAHLQR